MVEIHPLIHLDALAQTASEEILIKDWSLLKILPYKGTKGPARRERSGLGRVNLGHLGRAGGKTFSNKLLRCCIKINHLHFTAAARRESGGRWWKR
ncbi:hypothetical protein ACOSP7_018749 [Xanthoceras sorbifolium]